MEKITEFNVLYDKHWYQLYAYAFNILRNKQDTEDVIQEVFVDVWKRWDSFEIIHPKAYLYNAVKFQCSKKLQSSKFNEIQIESIQNALADLDKYLLEQSKSKEELLKKIDAKAKEILPEKCLKIFQLRYYENMSYKEIAHQLNISRSTVDNQLAKALKILRSSNIQCEEIITLSLLLSFL